MFGLFEHGKHFCQMFVTIVNLSLLDPHSTIYQCQQMNQSANKMNVVIMLNTQEWLAKAAPVFGQVSVISRASCLLSVDILDDFSFGVSWGDELAAWPAAQPFLLIQDWKHDELVSKPFVRNLPRYQFVTWPRNTHSSCQVWLLPTVNNCNFQSRCILSLITAGTVTSVSALASWHRGKLNGCLSRNIDISFPCLLRWIRVKKANIRINNATTSVTTVITLTNCIVDKTDQIESD